MNNLREPGNFPDPPAALCSRTRALKLVENRFLPPRYLPTFGCFSLLGLIDNFFLPGALLNFLILAHSSLVAQPLGLGGGGSVFLRASQSMFSSHFAGLTLVGVVPIMQTVF